MTTTYTLNENDIRKAIADQFKTDIKHVSLDIETVTVGYGHGEHDEHRVTATVES